MGKRLSGTVLCFCFLWSFFGTAARPSTRTRALIRCEQALAKSAVSVSPILQALLREDGRKQIEIYVRTTRLRVEEEDRARPSIFEKEESYFQESLVQELKGVSIEHITFAFKGRVSRVRALVSQLPSVFDSFEVGLRPFYLPRSWEEWDIEAQLDLGRILLQESLRRRGKVFERVYVGNTIHSRGGAKAALIVEFRAVPGDTSSLLHDGERPERFLGLPIVYRMH